MTLTDLALLPPGTLLDEAALAGVLHVSCRTVRRMVLRHELPPGTKLGARKVWFSERVLHHIRERAEQESVKAEQDLVRIRRTMGR